MSGQPEDDNPNNETSLEFEKRKWSEEKSIRNAELDLNRYAQSRLDQDFDFRQSEAAKSRRWNPLIVAVVGGVLTGLAGIYVAFNTSRSQFQVEHAREQAELIASALKLDRDKQIEMLTNAMIAGQLPRSSALGAYIAYLKETPPTAPSPQAAASLATDSASFSSHTYCYQEEDTRRSEDQRFLVSCNPEEYRCNQVRGSEGRANINHTQCVAVPVDQAKRLVQPGGFLGSSYAFSQHQFPEPFPQLLQQPASVPR
jgi:hypothetical protein